MDEPVGEKSNWCGYMLICTEDGCGQQVLDADEEILMQLLRGLKGGAVRGRGAYGVADTEPAEPESGDLS